MTAGLIHNFSKSKAEILSELSGILTGRKVTDQSNIASLIKNNFEGLNWVGFYDLEKENLWLGPFQGLPACTTIQVGRGVCGVAAKLKRTILVPDVSKFEGHIVCDINSRSELVVPIFKNEILIGVLDIDSDRLNRFSQEDVDFFESAVKVFSSNLQ